MLAFSRWEDASVVDGGESFQAHAAPYDLRPRKHEICPSCLRAAVRLHLESIAGSERADRFRDQILLFCPTEKRDAIALLGASNAGRVTELVWTHACESIRGIRDIERFALAYVEQDEPDRTALKSAVKAGQFYVGAAVGALIY